MLPFSAKGLPGESFMNSSYPLIIAIVFGVIFGIRSYFRGHQFKLCPESLSGKVIIVTGGTSGIGLQLAHYFCAAGAKVYIGGSKAEKGKEAVKDVKERNPKAKITWYELDFSFFGSVKKFAQNFLKVEEKLDILINNAGILNAESKDTSREGHQIHFQVNFLGHFLLTQLLLEILKKTPGSRVINNTAHAYKLFPLNLKGLLDKNQDEDEKENEVRGEKGEGEDESHIDDIDEIEIRKRNVNNPLKENEKKIEEEKREKEEVKKAEKQKEQMNVIRSSYAQSKLALILYTKKLASMLKDCSPSVYVVNPGVVNSDLYKNLVFRKNLFINFFFYPFFWFFMKTISDGAQIYLFCATQPSLTNGAFYQDFKEKKLEENALNEKDADFLYEKSMEICSFYIP